MNDYEELIARLSRGAVDTHTGWKLECREAITALIAERDHWRKDFNTLSAAITGGTGKPAILEADRLREKLAFYKKGAEEWEDWHKNYSDTMRELTTLRARLAELEEALASIDEPLERKK